MRSKRLIIITGILLISCVAEDSDPSIAAVEYQLFCDRGNGCNGLVSKPPRVVERAVDGQSGFNVDCSKGDKVSDLSLGFSGEDYGFSVESTAPGSSSECRIRINEGNNAYKKSCELIGGGDADCSETAVNDFVGDIAEMPCQVSVTIEGSTVTGTFCCRNIPEELKQAQGNELSLVLPQDFSKPARFEFKHCK